MEGFLFSCHLLKRQALGVGLQRLSESGDDDWAGSRQVTVKCGSESDQSGQSHARKARRRSGDCNEGDQSDAVRGSVSVRRHARRRSDTPRQRIPGSEESRLANENGRNGVC